MNQLETIILEIDKIKTNPFQPRKEFDVIGIKELSESIKVHGLIQPIVVRMTAGGYQVVAGERRMRACKDAGMETIPAIVIDIDGVDVAEVSLIENIQRKDLNCIEEANAYNILKSKFGMTQEEIAERLGKSRSHVGNLLRMIELPEAVKKDLFSGEITMGHGRALLALQNEEAMKEICERIKKEALSVRQTEAIIQSMSKAPGKPKEKKVKSAKYFKDARIYYNGIKKVIKDIKTAGGKAEVVERETEDYLELVVRILKMDKGLK